MSSDLYFEQAKICEYGVWGGVVEITSIRIYSRAAGGLFQTFLIIKIAEFHQHLQY